MSAAKHYRFGRSCPEIGTEVQGRVFILGPVAGRNISYSFKGVFLGETIYGFLVRRTWCSAHHEEVSPWWMDGDSPEEDVMTATSLEAAA